MGKILTIGNFATGASGSAITVVANFSALPDPTTVAGKFYWCSEEEGSRWVPGFLGGADYYNAGMYYSNGVTWEYHETPYQASQGTVNTGTNNSQFVTPLTLANYSRWALIYNTPLIISGARDNTTTDSYLRSDGVFTNLVPIEVPVGCKIKTIIAGTDGNETWTAEVHNNGVPVVGASLSLTAESSKTVDNLGVTVGVGAKLSLYCNEVGIKRPRILVILSNEI